jgi:hypothetical protein
MLARSIGLILYLGGRGAIGHHSASRARIIAGLSGFLTLIQSRDGPDLKGDDMAGGGGTEAQRRQCFTEVVDHRDSPEASIVELTRIGDPPSCLSSPLPSCSHSEVAWHHVVQ